MTHEIKHHTPGPWHVREWKRPGVRRLLIEQACENGGSVCTIRAAIPGLDDCNARLIAAAPDLLKVCLDLRDWVGQAPLDVQRRLSEAIAKAEGRK